MIAKTAKVKVNRETIAVVEKGQKFRLLKSQGAWIAIIVGDGDKAKRGWILASDVRQLPDAAVNEDSDAPPEPVDVRVSIDLTQFSPNMGPQSAMYFKIRVGNESADAVEFKISELELKVDGEPLPQLMAIPGAFSGFPVYTDVMMQAQVQPAALPFLKDALLALVRQPKAGWLMVSQICSSSFSRQERLQASHGSSKGRSAHIPSVST